MPTKAFERLQEEKKQKIINAALIEFSENTVDSASVNSIAKRAGVSRTTLYYYFSDIQEVQQDLPYAVHLHPLKSDL